MIGDGNLIEFGVDVSAKWKFQNFLMKQIDNDLPAAVISYGTRMPREYQYSLGSISNGSATLLQARARIVPMEGEEQKVGGKKAQSHHPIANPKDLET